MGTPHPNTCDKSSMVRSRTVPLLSDLARLRKNKLAKDRLKAMVADPEPSVVSEVMYVVAQFDGEYPHFLKQVDKWASSPQPETQLSAIDCLALAAPRHQVAIDRLP